jgi:pyruvate/2-oxoglutarate dehydrogenase complex dihydrolipoamide acyltransferase (E2) component
MKDVLVPKWGLTMEEATLVTWLKKVGDEVKEGEAIAEMETDKTTVELVSQVSGRIVEFLVEEGAIVEAGQAIARVE